MPNMWQDSLSTKSIAFARRTPIAQTPCSDLDAKNISFHNYTFNFGGVEGKGQDVEKIVSQIVEKLCAKGKRIVEEPVSILKNTPPRKLSALSTLTLDQCPTIQWSTQWLLLKDIKNQQQQKDLICHIIHTKNREQLHV